MSNEDNKPEAPDLSEVCHRNLFQILEPDGESAAEANVEERLGNLWLTSLWVKYTQRGKGVGGKILQAVIDALGNRAIYLHVLAFDGRSMADGSLIAFYSKFGFVETEVSGIMKRPAL